MTSATSDLNRLETEAKTTGDFARCEESWLQLLEEDDGPEILLAHNRFRLRNLPSLQVDRPGIVVGHMNDSLFPNFHTLGLLKIADVISLSTLTAATDVLPGVDRIYYSWANDHFLSLCKRFPDGFRPKLFWDNQAAHGHLQPRGLEDAPCPTATGLCHVHHTHACDTISHLFDFVAPVGAAFRDHFNRTGRAKVLDVGFGLNWASFHLNFIHEKAKTRNIDLSVTFSPSENPVYEGHRIAAIQLAENLKKKWGHLYTIQISHGLSKDDYIDLLSRSRISVNMVGLNGPYNYRTCEIMNAGALLFQMDTSTNAIPTDDEELFTEGEHFVRFSNENFEDLVLQLLKDPGRLDRIAKCGKERLEQKFSYEKLYTKLLEQTSEHWEGPERGLSRNESDHLLGKLLWNQTQHAEMTPLGTGLLAHSLGNRDDVSFYSNLLAILPDALTGFGSNWLFTIVRPHDHELSERIQNQPINSIAAFLFSKNIEHPALVWNFLSIASEQGWIPREKLQECARANFANYEWQDFDSKCWLLRHQSRPSWLSKEDYQRLRMDKLIVPLLSNTDEGAGEWRIHRDYLLELLSIPSSS